MRRKSKHVATKSCSIIGLVLLVAGASLMMSMSPGRSNAGPLEVEARPLMDQPFESNLVPEEISCDDGVGETGIISAAESWYGNLFELTCESALLSSVRFTHFGFGFAGPYSYNLHILDGACNELAVVNGLVASNAAGTPVEEIVDLAPLNLCVESDFQIMVEPLTCADAPSDQDCYPSMLLDLSPGGDAGAACSRIRLPGGNCIQFTVGGSYGNYLMRATIDCEAPVCAGVQDSLVVGTIDAMPGQSDVPVPVTLINSIPAGGFEFRIEYDSNLVEAVGAMRTTATADFEVFGVNLEEGAVTVVAIADFVGGGSVSPLSIGSAAVADVMFDVACVDVPSDTSFALTVTSAGISDSTGTVFIPAIAVDGQLTVLAGECDLIGVRDLAISPQARLLPTVFPNPSASRATIRYVLERDAAVTIQILDVQGRLVRRVASRDVARGTHEFRWDGRNDAGATVSPGTYFFKLQVGSETYKGKLTVLP